MSQRVSDPPDGADAEGSAASAKPPTEPPPSNVRPTAASEPTAESGAAKPDSKLPEVPFGATGANDGTAAPLDFKTRVARLSNRSQHAMIKGWLIKKFEIEEDVAEDTLNTALLRAWEKPTWPVDEKAMRTWLFTIARHVQLDKRRKEMREARVVLQDEDADHGVDPEAQHDAKDYLEFVERVCKRDPSIRRGLRVLIELEAGKPMNDIAADLGISLASTYRLANSTRELVQSRYAQAGAVVAVAFLILLLILRLRVEGPTNVASGGGGLAIDADAPLLELTHHTPAELRAEARKHWDDHDYDGCLRRLNHARRLDPEGEKDPAIAALRKELEAYAKRATGVKEP